MQSSYWIRYYLYLFVAEDKSDYESPRKKGEDSNEEGSEKGSPAAKRASGSESEANSDEEREKYVTLFFISCIYYYYYFQLLSEVYYSFGEIFFLVNEGVEIFPVCTFCLSEYFGATLRKQ